MEVSKTIHHRFTKKCLILALNSTHLAWVALKDMSMEIFVLSNIFKNTNKVNQTFSLVSLFYLKQK